MGFNSCTINMIKGSFFLEFVKWVYPFELAPSYKVVWELWSGDVEIACFGGWFKICSM